MFQTSRYGVLLILLLQLVPSSATAQTVLVEAEQFASLGGWELDQQAMDQMGSPYLLAHGLGVPVKDAVTRVNFAVAGTYQVWAQALGTRQVPKANWIYMLFQK